MSFRAGQVVSGERLFDELSRIYPDKWITFPPGTYEKDTKTCYHGSDAFVEDGEILWRKVKNKDDLSGLQWFKLTSSKETKTVWYGVGLLVPLRSSDEIRDMRDKVNDLLRVKELAEDLERTQLASARDDVVSTPRRKLDSPFRPTDRSTHTGSIHHAVPEDRQRSRKRSSSPARRRKTSDVIENRNRRQRSPPVTTPPKLIQSHTRSTGSTTGYQSPSFNVFGQRGITASTKEDVLARRLGPIAPPTSPTEGLDRASGESRGVPAATHHGRELTRDTLFEPANVTRVTVLPATTNTASRQSGIPIASSQISSNQPEGRTLDSRGSGVQQSYRSTPPPNAPAGPRAHQQDANRSAHETDHLGGSSYRGRGDFGFRRYGGSRRRSSYDRTWRGRNNEADRRNGW